MFICDIGLQFSFFVTSLSGFGIRVMEALQNEFGSVPPLCYILEEFETDSCQLFSKCLIEFSCEAIWSWAFVCWKIFNHTLISVLMIGLFIFSISSWFSLGNCAFLRICPFLPGCPFYWYRVSCSNLSYPLYFFSVCCYFSVFIFNSVDLCLFPFFLMSLANGLSICLSS